MKKLRMATPGPTQVPNEILLAGAQEMIHHRSDLMKKIMEEINCELPKIFGTSQDVYILLSSGTGAMEAAIVNSFNPGEKVLVVSNGYFGERFVDISKMLGLEVITVSSAWGTSVNVDEVKDAYYNHPDIKGVLVVYSETSTGAINNVKEIGTFFSKTDVLVVVDAISGLISHDLPMDDWKLDIVLGASHKGFMMPPGLAFVAISQKAWIKLEKVDPRTYYFSFKRYKKFYPMAPSSPGVSLLLSLKKSLEILNKEGLSECTSRHKKIAHATQSALEALGFPLFVKQPHLKSNTVTAAFAPIGLDASLLLKKLNQNYGLTVTGGQGEFKGKMIRVGHIGAVDEIDLFGIFGALEMALNEMDYNFELGSSSRAINKTIDRGVIPYA
ncbi:alanine--glyoxylate aminotransferase family protein [Priestia megaterium]|uniref:pyridoxal-phosphate-dependent aminotransferase family protein n=1 Tax=Priestia megaterium TaxID=1404 RepID=UPI002E1D697F|nr:alanine--glyoxylate aminotransferase family protein [Priestia megaterium]